MTGSILRALRNSAPTLRKMKMRIFTRSKWAVVEAAAEHKERKHVERVTDRATQRWHDYQAIKAMVGQCLEFGESGEFTMNIWHESAAHYPQRGIWRYGHTEYETTRATVTFGDHIQAVIYGDEVRFRLV
ncbi:hypothetical protein H1O03_gp56 [Klebsiella phage vB_KpnS_Alina]|uniref:Uncharacterized protein n=4 Tax=root TaxID=1 RepID=A0A5B9NLT3_9CAUD|nr:hypothetical protein H1O03_gp56 [Klebsiella phage vB_KpnS_Alina]QEG13010.1 hypothetical protein ALINA_56 [Klebsiella phage vB_KpnS_Alina]UGO54722.1 hypothetical protein CHELL_57 [Klebsiella phage vB_KpnD_Chell]